MSTVSVLMDPVILIRLNDAMKDSSGCQNLTAFRPAAPSTASFSKTVPVVTFVAFLAEQLLANLSFTTLSATVVVGWMLLVFAATLLPTLRLDALSIRAS
ncbi:hypothetical protein AAVH_31963, partial [Aphelenchoides avenae]